MRSGNFNSTKRSSMFADENKARNFPSNEKDRVISSEIRSLRRS